MLIAADLPAQEPRPEGAIDFESVIASAEPAGSNERGRTRFRDFNEVTKGAEKIEGLFTLYKTGDHLYAEIRPDQFNQTLLVPITIARGMAAGGRPGRRRRHGADLPACRRPDSARPAEHPLQGDRPVSPLDKSVQQNYTDSVLMALPIIALNPMKGARP